MFGNFGAGEIIIILVILLVIFGAKRLPEIGKSFGKGLKEFKNATREITDPFKEESNKSDFVASIETKEPSTSIKKENKKNEVTVEDKNV